MTISGQSFEKRHRFVVILVEGQLEKKKKKDNLKYNGSPGGECLWFRSLTHCITDGTEILDVESLKLKFSDKPKLRQAQVSSDYGSF